MNTYLKRVIHLIEPQAVVEGAGVRLKRSIGGRALDFLDPFLLLDHFDSKDPRDYQAGFPLHPHRGIETVTYILSGAVKHKDSLGSTGTIGAGDVQWMTAGRGILHEEMPQVRPEGISGFQLWVNLAAKEKMIAPRYQNISANEIPQVARPDGTRIRVITGVVDGMSGPVSGISVAPTYLDVSIPAGVTFTYPVEHEHSVFTYVFDGEVNVRASKNDADVLVHAPTLLVWGEGDEIQLVATDSPARLLLVSGAPLNEPISRHGPFVMNTRAEIEATLRELRNGTFPPQSI
ncbi:MAG: pirin family protein [Deltaproteobacteria bacterium]|nr:pirin family protein [Deltaproteobacteria bacterium]